MQKTLGMMIAELRKSQGMTQLELAEKMGVTDKAVSKWERDLSCPDINSLPKLAEALGVSVDELLLHMKSEAKQLPHSPAKIIKNLLKGVHCHYILYSVIMGFLLFLGAVANVQFVPVFHVSINFSYIINFLDLWGMFFVLGACLLVLIYTKSIRSLAHAFAFQFRPNSYTAVQQEDCLLTVKTAIFSAFSGGGMMFLLSIVNVLKSMDLSSVKYPYLGAELGRGLLSLVYAIVIALILLPVYASLKRSLIPKTSR